MNLEGSVKVSIHNGELIIQLSRELTDRLRASGFPVSVDGRVHPSKVFQYHEEFYKVFGIRGSDFHPYDHDFNCSCDGWKKFLRELSNFSEEEISKRLSDVALYVARRIAPFIMSVSGYTVFKYDTEGIPAMKIKLPSTSYLLLDNRLFKLQLVSENVDVNQLIRNRIDELYNVQENLVNVYRKMLDDMRKKYEEELEKLKRNILPMPDITARDYFVDGVAVVRTIDNIYVWLRRVTVQVEKIHIYGRIYSLEKSLRMKKNCVMAFYVNSGSNEILKIELLSLKGKGLTGPHWNPEICFGDAAEKIFEKRIRHADDVIQLSNEILDILKTINVESMYDGWNMWQELEEAISSCKEEDDFSSIIEEEEPVYEAFEVR